MTARYLLDTNVISERTSKKPNELVIHKLEKLYAQCAIAAPVWHELLHGCQRMPNGKRRTELTLFLQEVVEPILPVLPYDQVAATWHAAQRARLDALGKPTPFIDGQIAAIAHANNLIVVTRNTKDFARFEGIDVVDWSRPATTRN